MLFSKRCLIIFLTLAFVACSSNKPPPIPENPNSANSAKAVLPFSELEQTSNLTPAEAWGTLIASIQRLGFHIPQADENSGQLTTNWLAVTDYSCSNNQPSGAPLSCRIQIKASVIPYAARASKIRISFQEICTMSDEFPLQCPGSKGEKFVLNIVAGL